MTGLPHVLPALVVSALLMNTAACVAPHAGTVRPAPTEVEPGPDQRQQSAAFAAVIADLQADVDARLEAGIPVPVPVDAGGGYTHEQHKQNGKTIYEAGLLYRHTGDARYRDAVRDILLDYGALYPRLGLHPKQKEQTPGRLFWQSLNESVWLVYAIQGYAEVRSDLSTEARDEIETRVLNPMADFLSTGQPSTFDKIHNHGTWAVAAVGMTGYVLGQSERVEQALLGLDRSGTGGFLRQLDELFSPDGYYAEGPYYQRYALMPFVLFAQAIEQNEPEREIFAYRDGILLKAVRSTVEQSYAGRFFPINDAIREKGLNTVELKYGLAIAYDVTGAPDLLGAVQLQNGVVPTPEGEQLLNAIDEGKAQPFAFRSALLRDGAEGDSGGLAVLRSGPGQTDAAVVLKATTQGLGHGHFDRLGLLYFDNGEDVVADYGAARFLNVEPKFGGHYLPENTSWAKQTIAHNALVVDETSHFDGDWTEGQKHAPTVLAFGEMSGVQVAFAEISTAYPGVNMQRLIALMPGANGRDYVIDVVRGQGSAMHAFDLPVHFKGQLIETSFDLVHATNKLEPLGSKNGYQHLWRRGVSAPLTGLQAASWLLGDRFYTLSFASDQDISVNFAELGANDPDHNLRREQAMILRTQSEAVTFVSVYERHGRYDSDEEITVYTGGSIGAIDIANGDEDSRVTITPLEGDPVSFRFARSAAAGPVLKVERGAVDPARQAVISEGGQQ